MQAKLNIQKKIHDRRHSSLRILKARILDWMAERYGGKYTYSDIEDWSQSQYKGMFSLWVKYHKNFIMMAEPEDQEWVLDYFL